MSFFPRDILDEIWDLIESVSEGLLLPTIPRKPNKQVSEEPKNKGRGSSDRKLVEASSNFIAGRPKAALLL